MTLLGDSVLPSVSRLRSPQADHRFPFRVSPKKNEVAPGIAVSKREAYDFAIKLLSDLCVGNRKMCFVEMQRLSYFTIRVSSYFDRSSCRKRLPTVRRSATGSSWLMNSRKRAE